MMFLHVSVAVLSLLSLGQTAPLDSCENLIQPLEIQGPEQLLGKWMRVAVSSIQQNLGSIMGNIKNNLWMNITADDGSNVLTYTEVENIFGLCFTQTFKASLVNNTLQFINRTQSPGTSIKITLLKTSCPDCLLILNQVSLLTLGRRVGLLILASKRQSVNAAELEELKKQAGCLNLSEPFTQGFEDGICPDPHSPGADVIDWTALNNEDQLGKKALLLNLLSRMIVGEKPK